MCSLYARTEGLVGCFPESDVEKVRCRAGDLILGGFIDTCSKVHDNARKSDMND